MTQTVPERRRDTGPVGRLRRRVTSNEQEPNREVLDLGPGQVLLVHPAVSGV